MNLDTIFIHAFDDASTASIHSPLQHILLQAVDHLTSPYPWCEVCDSFDHFSADFQVLTSVLIDIPYYVWYNCRYIGLFDYADVLGSLLLCNPLNDHRQHYCLYSTYATNSPLLGILSVHLWLCTQHVPPFRPHRSIHSSFWPDTSL